TQFDLAGQQLQLGKLSSDKLSAWTEIDKNAVSNWEKLLPSAANDNSTTAPKRTSAHHNKENSDPATPAEKESQWQFIVKQAELSKHQFHFVDNSRSEPVALELAEFNLLIKDFDSQASRPFTAQLNTQVGEQ